MDARAPRHKLRRLLPAQNCPPQEPPLPLVFGSSIPPARNTSAACTGCRRRKTKCNRARPACKSCVAREITCQYDTNADETQSQALKRKFDEVSALEDSYGHVIAALRDRPEAEAAAILSRLRKAEDILSVARHIENGDLLLQFTLTPETNYRYDFPFRSPMPAHLLMPDNRYLESLVYEWAPQGAEVTKAAPIASSARPVSSSAIVVLDPYLKLYHAAKLAVPQLERVKPSKWTAVTADDKLMRPC